MTDDVSINVLGILGLSKGLKSKRSLSSHSECTFYPYTDFVFLANKSCFFFFFKENPLVHYLVAFQGKPIKQSYARFSDSQSQGMSSASVV